MEQAGLERVEVVRRRVDVDVGTPEVFMMTVGGMLGASSKQCSEHVRERWLVQIGEAMEGFWWKRRVGWTSTSLWSLRGLSGWG